MADEISQTKLTMSQIAAAAGVSISTVSKVINGRSDVSSATSERVERVISEYGYVANKVARSLRKGQSGQIDVIFSELHSYYTLELLRGVEEALASTPLSTRLIVTDMRGKGVRERDWINKIANGSTDGAILVLADDNSHHVQELSQFQIPFVVIDRIGELAPDIPSVGATNWAGGKAATQYLLSLGHRRIATIQGFASFSSTKDRLDGYRGALAEAGIEVDPTLIRYTDFTFVSACQQALALLDLPHPPTAIFVGNDELAFAVYRALHERKLSVPDDMSVVGFDDAKYASFISPALTTVRQPLSEMGRVAATMLCRLIANEPIDSIRVELATLLMKRASCAPPRQNAPHQNA